MVFRGTGQKGKFDIGDIDGKSLARHEASLRGLYRQMLEERGVGSVSEITARALQSLGETSSASETKGATGDAAEPVAAARGRVG